MHKLLIVHQMSLYAIETQGFADAKEGKPNRTAYIPEHWRDAYAKGYQRGLKPELEEDEELPF